MKKFLSVAIISFVMILVGCDSNKKNAEQSVSERNDKVDAILLAKSFWTLDSENMPFLNDAITRNDTEYLKQLMVEGKVYYVDKDTKIICVGATTNKNNALILFKEGRFTNKTGYTHASNIILAKDFLNYKEIQKEKLTSFIRDCLNNSENYYKLIAAEDMMKIKILRSVCLSDTNDLKSKMQDCDARTCEIMQAAVEIIFERDEALFSYESFIEYSKKLTQESLGSKKYNVYENMKKNFKNDMDKHSIKADQLRQEFLNKYGY